MTIVQVIATISSIMQMIAQLSQQAPTTSGARLLAINQGIQKLIEQLQSVLNLLRGALDQERMELSDEEVAEIQRLDDTARDVQRAAIEAAEDAPTPEEREEAQRSTSRKRRKKAD